MHVRPLPSGPLAFIGDVHGELEALESLHRHLDDRHRVYVGDLIDRGPDSPGVVRLVSEECEGGRASAILGNHELNLLRGLVKADNRWFRGEVQLFDAHPMPQAFPTDRERADIQRFLNTLPLALERDEVRTVHAGWGPIEEIRSSTLPIQELFLSFERGVLEALKEDGLHRTAAWRVRWKELFDRLVEEWGQELVNGALATHNVARFSELTPAKGKVIEASLKARARLVKEEVERSAQLAKEQTDANRRD